MNKLLNASLISALTIMSASTFAASVESLKCFTDAEMAKKIRGQRVSTVGIISTKIDKKDKFAIVIKESLNDEIGALEKGVYELSSSSTQDFTADVTSLDDLEKTGIKIETDNRSLSHVKQINIEINSADGSTLHSEKLSCSRNAPVILAGKAYLKAYEQLNGVKNNKLESITNDLTKIEDIYTTTKANTELRSGQYIALKSNKPFKKTTTITSYDENDNIIINDAALIGCTVKEVKVVRTGGKGKGSKKEITIAKCLTPNYVIKKRNNKQPKVKLNFRPAGMGELLCSDAGGSSSFKRKTPSYKRHKLRLVKRQSGKSKGQN